MRRLLLSAERFRESAIFLGLEDLKTLGSRSSALLRRVTLADQRLFADRFVRLLLMDNPFGALGGRALPVLFSRDVEKHERILFDRASREPDGAALEVPLARGVAEQQRNIADRSAGAAEIQKLAIKEGMLTLRESAVRKALLGITTVDEVVRCTAADR